ncbi:MAG: hypothetical protein HY517_03350 [Candidatus Aenigmarchaeota archaeon]|nr:hypothetical protein [Candidatus Aenigmarchaeota archaeon]
MPLKLNEEVSKMQKDIEEIKETLDMFIDNYIEMSHSVLEKDKDKFISLDKYKKKHGIRS